MGSLWQTYEEVSLCKLLDCLILFVETETLHDNQQKRHGQFSTLTNFGSPVLYTVSSSHDKRMTICFFLRGCHSFKQGGSCHEGGRSVDGDRYKRDRALGRPTDL